MKVRNAAQAMFLLYDGKWHRCMDLVRDGVQAAMLVELMHKGLVDLNASIPGSARLTERGTQILDRTVTRMLIEVDKKPRAKSKPSKTVA